MVSHPKLERKECAPGRTAVLFFTALRSLPGTRPACISPFPFLGVGGIFQHLFLKEQVGEVGIGTHSTLRFGSSGVGSESWTVVGQLCGSGQQGSAKYLSYSP